MSQTVGSLGQTTGAQTAFISLIIGGYFGSQIMYNLFKIPRQKQYVDEIPDLIKTIALSGLVYAFNGYAADSLSPMFYIGFIPGLLGAYLYSKLEYYNGRDNTIWNNVKLVMYLAAGIAVLISLYNHFEARHLIYILAVLVVVVLIIHTKQTENNTTLSLTPLNFGLTNSAFILLLLMQYAGSAESLSGVVANVVQGLVMGIFISGMSYYGIDYIVTDNLTTSTKTKLTTEQLITQRDILNDIQSIKWTCSFIITIIILTIIMFHIG